MIMDMGTELRCARAQLSADPDDWVWVRFYEARPDAEVRPGQSWGVNPIWDDSYTTEFVGPQILLFPSQHRAWKLSPFPGHDFRGQPQWFRSGLPLDARQADGNGPMCEGWAWDSEVTPQIAGSSVWGLQPPPVSASVMLATGGIAQGGFCISSTYVYHVAMGGQAQGGESLFYTGHAYTAQGGQAQGGRSLFPRPGLMTAYGGQSQGGGALFAAGRSMTAAGGQRQGGAAQHPPVRQLAGAGGQRQGGGALFAAATGFHPTGGQRQGGSAGFGPRRNPTPLSGQRQGGSSLFRHGHGWVAQGGQRQGGLGAYGTRHVWGGQGGQRQGGGARFFTGHVWTAAGGQRQGGMATITGDSDVFPPATICYTAQNDGQAPAGWLLANGQAVSRTTYAALFSAIGTTYGIGNGTTTFNVPDLRGRFPTSPGGPINPASLGATGGAATKSIALANLPSHAHNYLPSGDNIRVIDTSASAGTLALATAAGTRQIFDVGATQPAGGGTALDVVNPYLALSAIIKT